MVVDARTNGRTAKAITRAGRLAAMLATLSVTALAGCAAMTAGRFVQAGYDAAKTSITGTAAVPAGSQHVRQVMNSISIGQETAPIIASIGEPLKEKSGNLQGFTCYQYAAVYSPTEDAVIVSKDGKVVFFGNSTCRAEMQDANFRDGGKYTSVSAPPANVNTGADSSTGSPANAAAPNTVTAPNTAPK